MNTGVLVELTAIITAKAPQLIAGKDALSAESLAQYWSASKCRQQRWARSLKQVLDTSQRKKPPAGELQDDLPGIAASGALLEEIFASEVLTRVFAAIATLHDRRRGTSDAEPVARSVFMGHLESRRRALTVLASGLPISSRVGPAINHYRRRAERWNDLFIGCLSSHGDVAEFAFDVETAAQFADDFRGQDRRESRIGWALIMTSLRAAARDFSSASGNHDLHRQIAAAVLGSFGHDAFDSLGLPRSLWAARLLHTADSAHGLVEQLFAADRPAPVPKHGFIVRRARYSPFDKPNR